MRRNLSRYDRVLGCLLGAAVGDAMGAATETMSTE
jgi:ADP-ribosylglycohydrolase